MKMDDRNHFATSIDLSFSKLMELYDLTKETDLESVKEILDGFQSNRIIHVNMKYPSDDTVRLTNVNIREKRIIVIIIYGWKYRGTYIHYMKVMYTALAETMIMQYKLMKKQFPEGIVRFRLTIIKCL